MTEYDVIDRLSTRLRSDPRALFQLMDEYLRPDTTAEQHAYIRELVHPMRTGLSGERHAPLWNALTPADRARYLLAYISMIDGLPGIDSRDDTLMLNDLVNRALSAGVDLHGMLAEMRAISAQGALRVFRSVEDRLNRRSGGGRPETKQAAAYRPMTARERVMADTTLPHRYRSTPVIRLIVSAVIVSVIGLIIIAEGGDAAIVTGIVTAFLVASAVLYYVFYNAERPWPK